MRLYPRDWLDFQLVVFQSWELQWLVLRLMVFQSWEFRWLVLRLAVSFEQEWAANWNPVREFVVNLVASQPIFQFLLSLLKLSVARVPVSLLLPQHPG